MMQNDRFAVIVHRVRLSSREIAVAVALTVAAASFLVTTMTGDKKAIGHPVAVIQEWAE